MVTRRQVVLALGAGALAVPYASIAQEPGKVRRIGFLGVRSRSTPANPDVYYDAFVRGMRELGYVEGKNLVIEWRFADGKPERLSTLAAQLVQMNVEVIVTHATPGTLAAQRATSTLPIVFATATDPIASGFAATLARPGGNITGLSDLSGDLSPKRIELLKIMIPKLSRVVILVNPGNPAHPAILKSYQTAGQQIGIAILSVDARSPEEIEGGFATNSRKHVGAVIIAADGFFVGQARQVATLTLKYQMPSMFHDRENVIAGGLMSYGQNLADLYRRAATYVDKILKGARETLNKSFDRLRTNGKLLIPFVVSLSNHERNPLIQRFPRPGDLPIEQPTKIHLAINRKTAKALGLSINNELLLRADEMIE